MRTIALFVFFFFFKKKKENLNGERRRTHDIFIKITTLNGGSLGSRVDEERS